MASTAVTVEVRTGPCLRAMTDMARIVTEAIDLIPDWHADEKAKLVAEARRLMKLVERQIEVQGHAE